MVVVSRVAPLIGAVSAALLTARQFSVSTVRLETRKSGLGRVAPINLCSSCTYLPRPYSIHQLTIQPVFLVSSNLEFLSHTFCKTDTSDKRPFSGETF